MTPRMLRPIAWIAGAITLLLALVWVLQEAGAVEWLDDPLPGILAFGLITIIAYHLASKGGPKTD